MPKTSGLAAGHFFQRQGCPSVLGISCQAWRSGWCPDLGPSWHPLKLSLHLMAVLLSNALKTVIWLTLIWGLISATSACSCNSYGLINFCSFLFWNWLEPPGCLAGERRVQLLRGLVGLSVLALVFIRSFHLSPWILQWVKKKKKKSKRNKSINNLELSNVLISISWGFAFFFRILLLIEKKSFYSICLVK